VLVEIKKKAHICTRSTRTKKGTSGNTSEGCKTAEEEEDERKTKVKMKKGWSLGLTVMRIATNSRLNVKVIKPQVVRSSSCNHV